MLCTRYSKLLSASALIAPSGALREWHTHTHTHTTHTHTPHTTHTHTALSRCQSVKRLHSAGLDTHSEQATGVLHAPPLVNDFDLVDSHFPVTLHFYIELALGNQHFVILACPMHRHSRMSSASVTAHSALSSVHITSRVKLVGRLYEVEAKEQWISHSMEISSLSGPISSLSGPLT
jgi:hypothetical protein